MSSYREIVHMPATSGYRSQEADLKGMSYSKFRLTQGISENSYM